MCNCELIIDGIALMMDCDSFWVNDLAWASLVTTCGVTKIISSLRVLLTE